MKLRKGHSTRLIHLAKMAGEQPSSLPVLSRSANVRPTANAVGIVLLLHAFRTALTALGGVDEEFSLGCFVVGGKRSATLKIDGAMVLVGHERDARHGRSEFGRFL